MSGSPYLIELLGGDLDGKRFWFGCVPDEWRELLAASLRRVVVYRDTGTVRGDGAHVFRFVRWERPAVNPALRAPPLA